MWSCLNHSDRRARKSYLPARSHPLRAARTVCRTACSTHSCARPAAATRDAWVCLRSFARLLNGLEFGNQVFDGEAVAERVAGRALGDDAAQLPALVGATRVLGYERSLAAPHVAGAFMLELAVGLLHRVRVDAQLRGELANRWQRLIGLEDAQDDGPAYFVDDLEVEGPVVVVADEEDHVLY